ncbi:endonuclease III [Beggiatoa leptomitoformis]|uniref:Endonuclease III n=1 Tax=Beggiatoa leptomitoformis TaxID=288004 RepID=A0A2N9YEI3_9GAMM|nr:endonuclease III [Beggiatoa leptomitoformis]ALG68871.1 endonuclease III [Beggiatoa leptomitoformis]AUI68759.1 endonuclease III [Beggiatoa leptomitoformis]
MNAAHRHALFARLQAQNPNPKTELVYHSTFELLISVILSAQATDISVNKATVKLYSVANTPQAILNLGADGLKGYIKTIGLYNAKAKNILQTCQVLVDKYNGEVPHERAALEALAGVGRKTANVVLNTAFGEATIAVDTHIFRVANRTGLASGKTVRAVEDNLLKAVPPEYQQHAHHWLILHGRYTCTARNPKCASCVIAEFCEFKEKNLVMPNKAG